MVKKVTINDTPLVNVVVDKPLKKQVKKQTKKEVKEEVKEEIKEVKNEIQDEMNDEESNINESDLDSDSDDEIGKYEHRSNHGIYLFFQFIKKTYMVEIDHALYLIEKHTKDMQEMSNLVRLIDKYFKTDSKTVYNLIRKILRNQHKTEKLKLFL